MPVSLSSSSFGAVKLVDPVSPADVVIAGTPILIAAFATPADFLDAFAPRRGAAGELAVRTRASPPPGSPMVLEVSWHGLPNRVFVRVTAKRRWLGGHLVLALDGDEASKRDYLLRVAAGHLEGVHRRAHRRFLVRLPLTWRRFGETVMQDGFAEDLSSGGILVVSAATPPAAGDRVAMRVRAELAYQELVLTGEARHTHDRSDGRHAFGVRLQYRSNAQQRTLRSLLRAFAGRGMVIVDPSCE